MPTLPRDRSKPLEKHPNGQIVWARNAKNKPICNSRMRKKDDSRRCQQTIGLALNGRCEMHGGKVPYGVASPSFKHGQTSRYKAVLNPSHLKAFEDLIGDEDYNSLRNDIAIARIRLLDTIGEFGELEVNAVKNLFRQADFARELMAGEYDYDDLEKTLAGVLGTIDALESRERLTTSMERQQEHLRKLVDTENKKIGNEQTQMSAAKVMFLFTYMVESMRMHFDAQRKFLRDFYPETIQDARMPNPLKLIAADIEPLFPNKQLPSGEGTS